MPASLKANSLLTSEPRFSNSAILQYNRRTNALMGLANLLKVLYQLKDILIVYAPIKRVSKALNPSVQLCLLLWVSRDSGSFCYVQVLISTKSKKTDSDSVLYYSRNTNARALATGGRGNAIPKS